MPFTIYMRSVATILAALTGGVVLAQNGATKTRTVTLVIQGETHLLRTSATTVSELLKEQRIALGEQLQSNTPLTASVTEGMQLTLESKAKATDTKAPATTPVASAPKPAPKKPLTVASARGTLSSRGTLGNLSRYEGKRVLTLTATGYGPGENGPWGNRTALGTRVRFGVVAVDPRVIKLGTRLYVEGYGECVAEDTGGAIKGMRIDLAFNSDSVANQYGRRRVRVVILD